MSSTVESQLATKILKVDTSIMRPYGSAREVVKRTSALADTNPVRNWLLVKTWTD